MRRALVSAVRPTLSAKGVFAELASATRIPGYLPSACSCKAVRAPACSEILSPSDITPVQPRPRPFKRSPTQASAAVGTAPISNISLSHRHASRSKTHSSGIGEICVAPTAATDPMRVNEADEVPRIASRHKRDEHALESAGKPGTLGTVTDYPRARTLVWLQMCTFWPIL